MNVASLPVAHCAVSFPLPEAALLHSTHTLERFLTAINAILDALAEVGVEDLALPATPARVWAALEAAKR